LRKNSKEKEGGKEKVLILKRETYVLARIFERERGKREEF
jgi:hypothetical protein